MGRIIQNEKTIVIAADIPSEKLPAFVRTIEYDEEIQATNKIGGFKFNLPPALYDSLPLVTDNIRNYTSKPIIFDAKPGIDISRIGKGFMHVCAESGVNAVVLVPLAGPNTLKAWVSSANSTQERLEVIIGGLTTNLEYESEGGYLVDGAIMKMYLDAANLGVNNFIVPGNRPGIIEKTREAFEKKGFSPTLYVEGLITQGGKFSEVAEVAGDSWHAIIGSAIYEALNIRQATLDLTNRL